PRLRPLSLHDALPIWLDRRGCRSKEEPPADHEVPTPRRDRRKALDQATDRAERRVGVANVARPEPDEEPQDGQGRERGGDGVGRDRKSTRLNSSHLVI